jgi:hypothetical protein
MTTYRITSPVFVAALIANEGQVLQAAPVLGWAVGRELTPAIEYCKQRGWQVECLERTSLSDWIEFDGVTYEIKWHVGLERIQRITKHEDGEQEDVSFRDLPDFVKGAL